MPAIIYDFEEINKNILGDDWWKLGKREADKANEPCKEMKEPTPCTAPMPLTRVMPEEQQPRNQMANPIASSGLPGQPPFALPANAQSQIVGINNLLDLLNKRLAYESAQVEQRMKQIHELKMPMRKIERLLQEEWERHLMRTAPMRQHCDFLAKQICALMPPPAVIVAPEEYECEVHEGTPQSATHVRMSLAEQEKRYQALWAK